MRKMLSIAGILGMVLLTGFTKSNGVGDNPASNLIQNKEVGWVDIQTALNNIENNDRKFFFYVYTDWCGYCKRMSSTTFLDENVIKLLNEKFVPVKFNAESKEPVVFKGKEFKFIANGSKGYNEFAAALLNNRLSYPTLVFLDEKMNMIQPLPGYKSATDLAVILRYLGDKIYEKMSFEDYLKEQGGI